MAKVLIIGGGFAGVWSAASAAKLRRECGVSDSDLDITVVSAGDDLVIRPRLYESDPHKMRIPLDSVLGPIGVQRLAATVTAIDTAAKAVTAVTQDGRSSELSYDRLVLASGSQVVQPKLPGSEHMFDIDTLAGASRLDSHLHRLPERSGSAGQYTAVVIGAGFTGLEIATELTMRLREIAGPHGTLRVVLVEREAEVGPELGINPRPAIKEALTDLGIETRLRVSLDAVRRGSVSLSDGTEIATDTVVWTAGMAASPLTKFIPAERDRIGRLHVDEYLRVKGVSDVYAAGDTSAAIATEGRTVMQSCQHATPLGKFAGHNVAADLLGKPLEPFAPDDYVTCLALGPAGAVVTSGWERNVLMTGSGGRDLKTLITNEWIYPPANDGEALLAAAGPNGAWPEYSPLAVG
ncbi:NADH dehydrogenase [Pseudarthrobacter sp. W1I19]|uniref:NAD(P)/FAD-dependent oxidoreductase n=1 Tax=Pseudarthrobacter sp. W1I19 TaxID=3042288 RepID=UPI00278345B7|nr:FAD-dependent oxidoreductase [Pseudarthrobacter sp. W1I19]MDQ0925613.1 NADH dehydrogenase [Pseudarthrobacter sp. W1I19]